MIKIDMKNHPVQSAKNLYTAYHNAFIMHYGSSQDTCANLISIFVMAVVAAAKAHGTKLEALQEAIELAYNEMDISDLPKVQEESTININPLNVSRKVGQA